MDGMDQAKTNIPHFKIHSKSTGNQFYKVHLTAVRSHGTNDTFLYFDQHEWSSDSDSANTILLQSLLKVSKSGKLPPVIYIQMDNCYKENKNQWLFALCILLIKMKLTKKVRLSYLIVGHTHEDIDQIFSNISKNLRRNDATTLLDLKRLVSEALGSNANVSDVDYKYGIKAWLEPCVRLISYHSKYGAFKFKEGTNGDVFMWHREDSAEGEWFGPVTTLTMIPEGIPKLVKPTFSDQISMENLKREIVRCHTRLSSAQIDWWDGFIKSLEKKRKFWDTNSLDVTEELWILTQFKPCDDISHSAPTEDDRKRMEDLQNLIDKKNCRKKLKVKKNAAIET